MNLYAGLCRMTCCLLTFFCMKILPVCNEVVVADDPIFPRDELPNGADGAACSVGKRPEPTPWATPIHPHTNNTTII